MFYRLQILRAAAAIGVLVLHFSSALTEITTSPAHTLVVILHTICVSGVDVFFVISGFIVAHAYHARPMNPVAYLAKRALRIYSAYWMVLGAFLLLHLCFGRPIGGFLLTKSALVISVPTDKNPLAVVWTLYYELAFYVLFSMFLSLPRQWRGVVGSAFVLGAFVMFTIYWYFGYYESSRVWWTTWYSKNATLSRFLNPYLLEFAAGTALYYYRKRLPGMPWWPALVILIMAGLINAWAFGGNLSAGYYSYQRIIMVLPAAVILVIWAVSVRDNPGGIIKRWFVSVGDASYVLYLIHLPIVAVAVWLGVAEFSGILYAAIMVLLAVSTILLSIVLSRYVEKPAYHLLTARLKPLPS